MLQGDFPVENWHPFDVLERSDKSGVIYSDRGSLYRCYFELCGKNQLVSYESVCDLNSRLWEAFRNPSSCFIIQAGHCAEGFEDASSHAVSELISAFQEMSAVFPMRSMILMGRMAGQYAKPRSADFEADGVTLTYRGDLINGIGMNERDPDPFRLLHAHKNAALCISNIDAMTREKDIQIYTCHENLCLHYETALTRTVDHGKTWFDSSAHFLWLGYRTLMDSPQTELLSHIENPVGIKIGPGRDSLQIAHLMDKLCGENRILTLITRFGSGLVHEYLPRIVESVVASGCSVLWICDPMHGNTKLLNGTSQKVRYFDDILDELKKTKEILSAHGQHLNGVHLEISPFDDIVEVLGGHDKTRVSEEGDLLRYTSKCDPRLNRHQTVYLSKMLSILLD